MHASLLHVRFVAPLPSRIERVMRREGLSLLEAERRIQKEDQRRARHIRQYYQADWGAPDPYHLILNTALWNEASCIHLVLRAVEELRSGEAAEPPTKCVLQQSEGSARRGAA